MTDNTKPEPSEDRAVPISDAYHKKLFRPVVEVPNPSNELRLRIISLVSALNMRWCANTHAIHFDFMSAKISSFVQGEISRVRAEERERAQKEIDALRAALNATKQPFNDISIGGTT